MMHTYSLGGSKENIRRTIILWLFCFSVILCTLGNQLLKTLNVKFHDLFEGINVFFAQWPWMGVSISAVSAFAVFGILFWLFDNFVWKWRIAKKITGIPDFTGEWKGILKSSFDESKEFPIHTVIKQTWSRISILCHFDEADSWSDTAHFDPDHARGMMLKFTYENSARNVSWEVRSHRGDNTLFLGDYDEKSKQFTTLKGDYFNNRGEHGNVGYIELKLQK